MRDKIINFNQGLGEARDRFKSDQPCVVITTPHLLLTTKFNADVEDDDSGAIIARIQNA